MYTEMVIDIIEGLGVPVGFSLLVFILMYMMYKNSARRDTQNSQIQLKQLDIQKQQADILDKLSHRVHQGTQDIQAAIAKQREELQNLFTTMKDDIIKTVKDKDTLLEQNLSRILKAVEEIPEIVQMAQADYAKRIETGIQKVLDEIEKSVKVIERIKTHEHIVPIPQVNPNIDPNAE